MPTDFANVLSGSQMSRRLGMSEANVRKLAAQGTLPSITTPLGRLYREQDAEAFAKKREAQFARQTVSE